MGGKSDPQIAEVMINQDILDTDDENAQKRKEAEARICGMEIGEEEGADHYSPLNRNPAIFHLAKHKAPGLHLFYRGLNEYCYESKKEEGHICAGRRTHRDVAMSRCGKNADSHETES